MNIDSETMKAAVAKAILDSLGAEGKVVVLENAVMHLLELMPDRNGHVQRGAPTRIQAMFNEQAGVVLREIVRDQLRDNQDFKDRVSALVVKTMDEMFGGEALANKTAEMISHTLSKITLERY